jgi:hypothetical protein
MRDINRIYLSAATMYSLSFLLASSSGFKMEISLKRLILDRAVLKIREDSW